MNVIIPMAGDGSRFRNAGYSDPKPLIPIDGKPMIQHVLDNLFIHDALYYLIVKQEHYLLNRDYFGELVERYPVRVIVIKRKTLGAACTLLYANPYIGNEEPLIIANCDQIVHFDVGEWVKSVLKRGSDGAILTFPSKDPKWSYARVDERQHVVELKEKTVISPYATVGIYMFTRGTMFVESVLEMIENREMVNGEFYTCPVYNYSINRQAVIENTTIPSQAMFGIGTPEDLERYKAYLSHKSDE